MHLFLSKPILVFVGCSVSVYYTFLVVNTNVSSNLGELRFNVRNTLNAVKDNIKLSLKTFCYLIANKNSFPPKLFIHFCKQIHSKNYWLISYSKLSLTIKNISDHIIKDLPKMIIVMCPFVLLE